ncbi:hypothetical protein C8R42DRAFT_724238 [Lentinula raphanica]|nr:hypothetical protein C8R42DRAFT_724238 [Lentinula raphanica]
MLASIDIANERATHSSQTARGVESIEAACDVWAWTCREYHTHDNRNELVLYSDSVCEPRETRETREVVEQPIISHDDQRNRPQINIAQLNIESRPNPVIDSPPSPSKKTSTKVPSPKTFFNPPIPSTSKSPSSNQLKGIDIDAISSLLSDQSISTPGPSKKGRANPSQSSSTSGGVFVVKWEDSYEIHSTLESAKLAFDRAQSLDNEVTLRYSRSWDAAMAFAMTD